MLCPSKKPSVVFVSISFRRKTESVLFRYANTLFMRSVLSNGSKQNFEMRVILALFASA